MAATTALSAAGLYAPMILSCGHLAPTDRRMCIFGESYSLQVVKDGVVSLDGHDTHERYGPGEAFLLAPAAGWSLQASPGGSLLRLIFDVTPTAYRQRRRGGPVHARPSHPQPDPVATWGVALPQRLPAAWAVATRRTLEAIRLDYWVDAAYRARATGRLSLLLGELAVWALGADPQLPSETSTAGGSPPPPSLPDLVARAQAAIRVPVRKGHSVAGLADLLGVSREYLTRVFTAHTGLTPGQAIEAERRKRALRLLHDSDADLRQIGDQLGFRHAASFTRAFRRWYGLAPSAYRRSIREGHGG